MTTTHSQAAILHHMICDDDTLTEELDVPIPLYLTDSEPPLELVVDEPTVRSVMRTNPGYLWPSEEQEEASDG